MRIYLKDILFHMAAEAQLRNGISEQELITAPVGIVAYDASPYFNSVVDKFLVR